MRSFHLVLLILGVVAALPGTGHSLAVTITYTQPNAAEGTPNSVSTFLNGEKIESMSAKVLAGVPSLNAPFPTGAASILTFYAMGTNGATFAIANIPLNTLNFPLIGHAANLFSAIPATPLANRISSKTWV